MSPSAPIASNDATAPRAAATPVLPELLAPAGDWDCARAAVENGADAIYFGLSRFNARLRAQNFSEADLPKLMAWLHERGVRGYVTFNTLVFTQELPEAEAYLRTLIAAGVDAAIVQDVGLCRMIRSMSPDFPIHASTQMTVTSAAGVAFARELGCQLVVLARENSIREMESIRATLAGRKLELPMEVFVHGALCVAYSGQCLTSEALGGRSANRGECAQACRMPYDLIADGQAVPLGDRRYLLSPQDLAGIDLIPALAAAGIASLKIEGRLKSPEYVASITRLYRAALDRLSGTAPATPPASAAPASDRTRYELEMAFSRGLYSGWMQGIDNQKLVHARFGKKRGAYLGPVLRIDRDEVWIRREGPVKAGDGVVFDAGRPDQKEEGGRIFAVREDPRKRDQIALTFLRGAVDFPRLQPGDRVWKTSDPELEKNLRQTFETESPGATRPITMEVHGSLGQPLVLRVRDQSGHLAEVTSSMPLAQADRQPLDEARLRDQLGRLGGTPFHLGTLAIHLEGPVILPVRELNRMRRDATAALLVQRAQPPRWTLRAEVSPSASFPCVVRETVSTPDAAVEWIALARTRAQLEAIAAAGVRTVYCEFEDPKRYRDAMEWARAHGGLQVLLAPPRIHKPGEDWILNLVESAKPDGYLVRNYDHLERWRGMHCVGDFSLNVANPLTAEYFVHHCGLRRVTASYDLNADQLEALIRTGNADWYEITLHQHIPMFHMEHCVFCAFLSSGKDYHDCGRPCDRKTVHLRDRVGASHPVKADAGCRNTVFNARAQTGADHALRLFAAGARRFRLEFLDESPEEVAGLIQGYRRLLAGEISAESLWREFRLVNQLGVTRGQLGKASGADLGVDRWNDTRAYRAAW